MDIARIPYKLFNLLFILPIIMNSGQINRLLCSNANFLGVFPSDKLPHTVPSSSFSIVVNTDPSNLPGTHWQAIIVNENILYFFDSFGNLPKVEAIKIFCSKFPIVYYNQKRHQNIQESTCGAYCVYVINEMSRGRSFHSILKTLKGIKRDDAYVRKYLIRHFNFFL